MLIAEVSEIVEGIEGGGGGGGGKLLQEQRTLPDFIFQNRKRSSLQAPIEY